MISSHLSINSQKNNNDYQYYELEREKNEK